VVDLNIPEEKLQYRPWLCGSPPRSCWRNTDVDVWEECRLFEAFRKNKQSCKAQQRLVFFQPKQNDGEAGGSNGHVGVGDATRMVVDKEVTVNLSSEVLANVISFSYLLWFYVKRGGNKVACELAYWQPISFDRRLLVTMS